MVIFFIVSTSCYKFSLYLFLFIDLKRKGFLQDSSLFEYSFHKEHAQGSVAVIHLKKNFHSYVDI